MYKATIVIPNINGKGWLKDSIESVYAQTEQSFRLIVVDNGSTDESLEQARSYCSRKNFGVGLGGADQLRQPLGFGKGIVVEQHHVLAVGQSNALIHRVGKAGVAAVFDQGKVGAGAIAARLRQAFVRGAVVHYDQVKILLGLGVDGLDGVL